MERAGALGRHNAETMSAAAAAPLVLDGFFTRAECDALIQRSDSQKWHQATINVGDGEEELDLEERKHMRTFVDDAILAAEVSFRLKEHVPHDFVNPRFRTLSYVGGDFFAPHFDGEQYHLGGISTHTVILYLNDVPAEAGGATRFCDTDFKVHPVAGRALVFKQEDWLHEGERLVGTCRKIVMRTDLMHFCPTRESEGAE